MGQLGVDPAASTQKNADGAAFSTTPVRVEGLDGVVAISAGDQHVCALLDDGSVKCWGENSTGQLGFAPDDAAANLGDRPHTSTPVLVEGVNNAVAVSAGSNHTCALISSGSVMCWGGNTSGQAGLDPETTTVTKVDPKYNFTSLASVPAPPGIVTGVTGATAVSAGYLRTCALTADATVICWGSNEKGGLGANPATTTHMVPAGFPGNRAQGQAELSYSWTPVPVAELQGVQVVVGGSESSCALLMDGRVACWGSNDMGQLGLSLAATPDTVTPAPWGGEAEVELPVSWTPVQVQGIGQR
jgi:alpha-tubulin suppressor-like RCC1 family protein